MWLVQSFKYILVTCPDLLIPMQQQTIYLFNPIFIPPYPRTVARLWGTSRWGQNMPLSW